MKGQFAALVEPPHWLQQDMLEAQNLVEGQTAVFFSDDLLGMLADDGPFSRKEDLCRLYRRAFGAALESRFAMAEINRMEQHTGGVVFGNWKIEASAPRPDHQPYATLAIRFPATAHVIILRSSTITTQKYTHLALKAHPLLCQDKQRIRTNQLTFWHEVGHVDFRQNRSTLFHEKEEETEADRCAIAHTSRASGSYYVDIRTVAAFLSPLEAENTRYWSPLSLRGIKLSDAEEMATVLEIKYRAMGLPLPAVKNPTSTPERIVSTCLFEGPEKVTSNLFPFVSVTQRLTYLLDRLQPTPTLPYVMPHAQELAEQVIQSAHRLLLSQAFEQFSSRRISLPSARPGLQTRPQAPAQEP